MICRSTSLERVTKLLRDQLDEATSDNQSLSAEVAKLDAVRQKFETREADFNREEQVCVTSPYVCHQPLTYLQKI